MTNGNRTSYLPRGSAIQVYARDLLGASQTATITNVSASGSVITYTANNNFSVGDKVTITGINPAAYNLTDVTIASRTSSQFTVANSATGTFVSGGTASLVSWIKLTEHNRSELGISIQRIEQAQRMANGSLRKYFVADKKQFDVSWAMLPGTRGYTVDGQWGALDLIEFYNSTEGQGTFNIRLNFAKSGTSQESSGYEEYTVSCTSFSATLLKRGEVPFYNVSMSMEQV